MCVKTSSVTSVRESTKQTYIAPTKDEQVLNEESDIIIIIILVIIIAIKANCDAQRGFARESEDYLYIIHQQILHMLNIS